MGGGMWEGGVGRMEWSEGGKWDNCNSIINKYIYTKETLIQERTALQPCCLEVLKWEERACSTAEYLWALFPTPGCQINELPALAPGGGIDYIEYSSINKTLHVWSIPGKGKCLWSISASIMNGRSRLGEESPLPTSKDHLLLTPHHCCPCRLGLCITRSSTLLVGQILGFLCEIQYISILATNQSTKTYHGPNRNRSSPNWTHR